MGENAAGITIGVHLLHDRAGRAARRPCTGGTRFVAHLEALVGILVSPDVTPFVQRAELGVPGAHQRRELLPAFDFLGPTIDHAGDRARLQRVLADFEDRPDLPRLQRRRERRRQEHFALLRQHEFADRRRPAFFLRGGGAHGGAMLEAVISPRHG